jgi:methylthioribose-1-phosphate isomerase
MAQGEVNLVLVGADRVAENGDIANKIGTFEKAVLAHEHAIPFYVAAPISTFDFQAPTGKHIPIEERDARELTHLQGKSVYEAPVRNPAFDVTPAKYITGIVTEEGIFRPEEIRNLKKSMHSNSG